MKSHPLDNVVNFNKISDAAEAQKKIELDLLKHIKKEVLGKLVCARECGSHEFDTNYPYVFIGLVRSVSDIREKFGEKTNVNLINIDKEIKNIPILCRMSVHALGNAFVKGMEKDGKPIICEDNEPSKNVSLKLVKN